MLCSEKPEVTTLAGRGRHSQSAQLFASRPRKNPLFIVDLVLDNSGVHYSTPLEHFEMILLNLFDKGILATHAVPQLEKVHATGWAGSGWLLRATGCSPHSDVTTV